MRRPAHSSLWWLAAALAAPLAAASPVLDELALARDVICTFHRSGPVRVPPALHRTDGDLMLIIEGIGVDPETASMISSRAIGARPARVYASDTRVHFVEDVNESVIVTTVLDCETWRPSGQERKCMRFAAVIAWHFDRSVHKTPDRTFLGLPGSSYTGHCEPWNLE